MPPIKIVYAYDGLIYLPLLLAKELGYLPDNVILELAPGDEEALQKIIEEPEVKFAICDPFYLREVDRVQRNTRAFRPDISVIGCLINKPPFWIYTSDRRIHRVNQLSDLFALETIQFVGAYAYPNTGYLYGIDIVQGFLKAKKPFVQRSPIELDPRRRSDGKPGEIQVTANAVKVAVAGEEEIIYAYPNARDATGDHAYLHDIFFTGILARNDFLESNMTECTNILHGIRRAIRMITENRPDLYSHHLKAFFRKQLETYEHLANYTDEQFMDILHKIIFRLNEGDIYSKDLSFNKKQWKKMDALRNVYQHDHRRLNYYSYVNKSVLDALDRTQHPKKSFRRRLRESRSLWKLSAFFLARPTEWFLSISILIGAVTVEFIDRCKTTKYLVWDSIAFVLVSIFIFYAIRERVAKKLYNEQWDIPEPLIFFLRVIVLGFITYNLNEVIKHH